MLENLLSNLPPQSSDFFSSPVWQFFSGIGAIIAIPIAIIAVVVAILAYRQQKQRKEIAYQIISNAPIISFNQAIKERVQVLIDGKPIKNARLIVFKIWNSGNISISTEDYFEPIGFKFEKDMVLGSDLLETEPKDLIDQMDAKSFLKAEPQLIELTKFALNPGNSISFTALLAGKSSINKSGRIKDGIIKEISSSSFIKSTKRVLYILLFGYAYLALTTMFLYLAIELRFENGLIRLVLFIGLVIYLPFLIRAMISLARQPLIARKRT